MSYNAAAIANYFLEKAWSEDKSMSPMKIQKLVYFAHGWHWALADRPLIDEQVQAWRYGPVIPSLYHGFKEYGNSEITNLLLVYSPESGSGRIKLGHPTVDTKDKYVIGLLDRVWELYGPLTAIQLSNLTHREDGPWKKALKECLPGEREIEIDRKYIKDYFKSLMRTVA